MLSTGMTDQSKAEAAALVVQGEFHWFRGSLHACRGSSLWFSSFGLVVVCSLPEHVFVSVVLSHCPFLRGPKLVFFE
jgi:hypothetical protein